LLAAYPDCVVMSARHADDVARLREAIIGFFRQDQVEAEVFLPWSAQQQRGQIFATCEVLNERADESGATLRVRGERATVLALAEQLPPPA
jgi:GTP-binding protein HflX